MKWGDRLVIDPNGVGQVECGGVHGVVSLVFIVAWGADP